MSFLTYISFLFFFQAFFTNVVYGTGNWTVSENGDYFCIQMFANLTLFIEYDTKDGNSTARIDVTSATVDESNSTCNYNFSSGRVENNEQILTLIIFDEWTLKFKFTNLSMYTQLAGDNMVSVYQVELKYKLDETHFPKAMHPGQHRVLENKVNKTNGAGALKLFSSMNDRSYACQSIVNTTIVQNILTIQTSDVNVEAFMPNTTRLYRKQYCSADLQDGKSDLIPIIIGAALAALVVIVLIAYLIGRARTKRTVYETI